MRGPLVREAQGLMNSYFGAVKLEPDSRFGPRTEELVKQFQSAMKIKADGVIGPATWSALRRRGQAQAVTATAAGVDQFDIHQLESYFQNLRLQFDGVFVTPKAPVAPALRPASMRTAATPGAAAPAAVARAPAHPAARQAPKVVSVTDFKNFLRVNFEGYAGLGYVVKNFRKFEGCAIRLLPSLEIREAGADLAGFKNECAQFVQYFGVPNTKAWRRGPRVCDFNAGELAPGTVIATLREGKYFSDYSGRSHVGLYLSHTDYQKYLSGSDPHGGLKMMDQFNGNRIAARPYSYAVEADAEAKKAKKEWTDGSGKVHSRRVQWGKDGEEYYVLLTNP
jgi:hypothetical protein